MKRFLLYLSALMPFCAFAQISTGYYRVQNVSTKRYMSIVDTHADFKIGASYKNYVYSDLEAIHMLTDFEDSVSYNPATICYVEYMGKNAGADEYNLSGQGLNLHGETGRYLNAIERPNGEYRFYATGSAAGISVTRYLIDNTYHGTVYYPSVGDETDSNPNRNWNVLPVSQGDGQYFGIKPDVNAGGAYWATMYAGFAYNPSEESTKIYRVSEVDEVKGYAIIKELTADVPANMPVLIHCAAEKPSGNKMTLLTNVTVNYGSNALVGNWYCNDVKDASTAQLKHRNVTAYNPSNMRVLGVTSDGKPAFVKGTDANLVRSKVDGKLYLPANRCYLSVSSSAPDELLIITEEDYAKGSQQASFDNSEKYSDVSDNTIDNAYFNLPSGDGYDASENGIVMNSTMTAEQMDAILKSDDPAAAIKSNYKGIILEVPASYGIISVNLKTKGSHVLMVQIGEDGTPKQVVNADGGVVNINYNVAKTTKVYIYGAEVVSSAVSARRTAADNSVVLYGYEVSLCTTGIENIQVSEKINTKDVWYTLDGRRLQSKPTTKGLYIVNGKKVVIK